MATKISKADLKSGEIGKTRKGGTVIQRKITMKELQKLPMDATMKLAGIVTKTEMVTTNYGESTRFIGNFAAKMPDGSIIRSGVCFVPKAAEGMLAGALAGHMNDEKFTGVEFAFEIGKVESKASKTGYEWSVKTLIDTVESEDKVLLLLGN